MERTAHGLVLSAASPAARALGLRRGQGHADAKAIIPHLESAPAEPGQARAGLERLALWAERFSPAVAADALQPGFEGLCLDMTGGAHLFGGEGALVAEIERRLTAAAIPARAAMADTPGAAWALARFAEDRIAPEGRAREALAGLPVEALRLGEPTLRLLRRFGLRRVGDLYGLPRAGLARRFRGEEGLELVRRFDQALGILDEPLQPVRPAPVYRAWRAFAEPVIDADGVAHALPDLARALAAQLERDRKGARRLVLTGFRVDGRTTAIEAGLSVPQASPDHLLRLLKERGLERLDLGFGVDALMLTAAKAETRAARQGDLDPAAASARGEALAALIDRHRGQARRRNRAASRPSPKATPPNAAKRGSQVLPRSRGRWSVGPEGAGPILPLWGRGTAKRWRGPGSSAAPASTPSVPRIKSGEHLPRKRGRTIPAPSSCSIPPSRSRPWPSFPTARPCASSGGG